MTRVLCFFLIAVAAPLAASAQDGNEESGEGESVVDAVAGQTEAASEEEAPDEETGPPAEQESKWKIDGSWSNWFRYEHADGENKLIWFSDLTSDAVFVGGKVPFRIHLSGRLALQTSSDAGDLLYNTWDTFGGALNGRLYELYIQSEAAGSVNGRAGRMFFEEGTWLQFDGGRVDFDIGKAGQALRAYVVGGVPVGFRGSRSDSWMAGAVVKGQIQSPRTRWRVEYLRISELFPGINDPVIDPIQQPVSLPATRLNDDLLGLTVWHRTADNQVSLFGRFSLLNSNANELHLRGRWISDDGTWTVLAEWYQLFERLLNVVNDLTPYVPMLGSYEPFGRITGRVTYRAPNWIVQGGLAYRALLDDGIESLFNHEYLNYYFTATRIGFEKGRLDATLTVSGFATDQNETHAVGGSLDYRPKVGVTLSTGLDYSLWKYDHFRNTEHEDVWTFWLRARWKIKRNTTLQASFEVDDDRFATYTTLSFRAILRF